jgi:hypothetical protein
VTDLAPDACIVCGKPVPDTAPKENHWVYLSGSTPLGAIACSLECTVIAVERFNHTGRCDAKGKA